VWYTLPRSQRVENHSIRILLRTWHCPMMETILRDYFQLVLRIINATAVKLFISEERKRFANSVPAHKMFWHRISQVCLPTSSSSHPTHYSCLNSAQYFVFSVLIFPDRLVLWYLFLARRFVGKVKGSRRSHRAGSLGAALLRGKQLV
jgi:hypothetical protein